MTYAQLSRAEPIKTAQDFRGRLVYTILLPLFVISEGIARLYAHFADEIGEPVQARGAWLQDARSQASIATSCVLMAKSMLQSSERRPRPERLSRS